MKTRMMDGTILLRPIRPGDAASLHAAARESEKELLRWMRWMKRDFSLRDSAAWIREIRRWRRRGQAFNFGIFDRNDGRFLGSIWLSQVNHRHRYANLGYWVRTGCTGRGIATAAVRLIAQFGFEEAGLNRLEILAGTENKASQRVAGKVGAKREGVLRQRLLLQNRFEDGVLFSLLKEERRNSTARRRKVSETRSGIRKGG